MAGNARTEAESGVRSLVLGPERLERNLALAPMAGVTSLPFRLIARQAGASLVFSETVSARGIVNRGARSWKLVETTPRETPIAFQLFGNAPEMLGEATRLLVDQGARFIDLNLGCPVKKFLKHGAGACLLRDPPKVAPLVAAMRRSIPDGVLSVKLRLGWDQRSITAPEVARIAEAEGADFAAVHGRTRAQLYRGRADCARIAEVVDAVQIPVFANGDIVTADGALEVLRKTGAAGVMIGRGALRNPWIFSQIIELASGKPMRQPTATDRARLVERHLDMMIAYVADDERTVHLLKRYLCAYAGGLPGAGAFRARINRAEQLDGLVADALSFFRTAA